MRQNAFAALTALPRPPSWILGKEWGRKGKGRERKGEGEGKGGGLEKSTPRSKILAWP